MSFKIDKKKHNKLFQVTEKLDQAEDHQSHRIQKYGSDIIVSIPLKDIQADSQVRRSFDKTKIEELADSITQDGLLYPIIVMQQPNNPKKYTILVGESRFRAFQYLKKETIPARIKPFIENSADRTILQLTENLKRNNLTAIETANACMAIKKEHQLTLEQLAKRIGLSIGQTKKYSMIYNLSKEEKKKFNHYTFKQIMTYLTSKNTKSSPGELLSNPVQLELFKQTKTTLKLKPLSVNLKTASKDDLEQKIEAAKQFIKKANQALKKIN
ncbi:ParB/RepB/Spo0J family partition protein [bacterium]|nr:ParB/RepB/Spo0J family partition protein [bacterium]